MKFAPHILSTAIVLLISASCVQEYSEIPLPNLTFSEQIGADFERVDIQCSISGNVTPDNLEIEFSKDQSMSDCRKKSFSKEKDGFVASIEGLEIQTEYYYRYIISNKISSYTDPKVRKFKTKDFAVPEVNTGDVADVSGTRATLNGTVGYTCGKAIIEKGFKFGKSKNAMADKPTGSGDLILKVEDLEFGTQYYYQAYAKSEVGTGVGDIKEFTTNTKASFKTVVVSDVTVTSAKVSGGIDDNGGMAVEQQGFRYREETASDYTFVESTGTASLNGLKAGTKYLVWYFAKTADGEFESNQAELTTLTGLAELSATEITNITAESARFTSSVIKNNGGIVKECGFCYGMAQSPTVEDNKVLSQTLYGQILASVSFLTKSTKYYVRSFATTEYGTSYGAETSFETSDFSYTFESTKATEVTASSMTLSSTIAAEQSSPISSRGFAYGTKENPVLEENKIEISGTTGTMSGQLVNLKNNTTYYIRPFVVNSSGAYYGEQISATTLSGLAELGSTTVSNISATAASFTSTIINNNGGNIMECGFCFGTSQDPSVEGIKVMSQALTGAITATATTLAKNTTYFVRSFATTEVGTSYGAQASFQTKESVVFEAVDLGLSVKWATINLGASSPEEYGDYFAWGETEAKAEYSWESYKYANGTYKGLTKYCCASDAKYWAGQGNPDCKRVLDLEDDVAYVNWGGNWRMPTKGEQDELCSNCSWIWTKQGEKSGYKVISNVNGNSIFLPAAGNRYSSGLYYAGSYGYYWSSSLESAYTAYNLGFHSSKRYFNISDRGGGCSVRPVYGEFVAVSSVSLNSSFTSLGAGDTVQLTATITPPNATDKTISWATSDSNVATVSDGLVTAKASGIATITAYGSSGVSASCTVTVKKKAVEPEYVDLGLPSGLKWATFNVGASNPKEFGDSFAWGETEPKSNYNWSTYKFELGTDIEGPFSKYVTNSSYGTVDNKTVLDLEDDAAHVNWGGAWRIPTDDEWTELRTNCTWAWTSQNGVSGRLVTGPNGKSIFLREVPNCYYWSSSLDTDYPGYAWSVYFNSGIVYSGAYYRYYGFSVRPVYGEFVAVSSVSLNSSSANICAGETVQLTATITPPNATDKTISWATSDSNVATVSDGLVTAKASGIATITAYGSSGVSASCKVTVTSKPVDPEFVDLGLSVKWATFNVGATKSEEYGDYFAWGEAEPKTDYSWSTYKFELGTGFNGPFSKYVINSSFYGTVDNKTILDLEDDAAHVNWGGAWRIPTDDEWTELRTKCIWTLSSKNGVSGRLVTGPNGKSIFLPAAGHGDSTYLRMAGSEGYYWSSSLSTDRPVDAWGVGFSSGYVYRCYTSRYHGQSVRPVSE